MNAVQQGLAGGRTVPLPLWLYLHAAVLAVGINHWDPSRQL
jgi:hypothetical protein